MPKFSQVFTKEQLRRAARERLEECEPMERTSRPEGNEVVRVGNEFRLREHVPAKLEITELAPPGVEPWKVFLQDNWDSDFAGVSGTPFADWNSALAVAKGIAPGYRATVEDGEGRAVLRVVHHPAKTISW